MLPLIYFAGLEFILVFTHGHYSEPFVLAMVALHAALTFSLVVRPHPMEPAPARSSTPERMQAQALTLTLLLFSLVLVYSDQLYYPAQRALQGRLREALMLLPLLTAVALGTLRFVDKKIARGVLLAVGVLSILLLVGARVGVLYVSPSPHIDVFTTSRQAVEYFLAGKNPYAQSYVDIYKGAYDYAPAFPYWPGYLYWASGWAALLGGTHDVRASLVIAESLGAGLLVGWMIRAGSRPWLAVLAAAVWLAFPIDLFVIEQAWIDPLLVTVFLGAAWAAFERRWWVAGALLGFACGTKQYALIGAVLWFAWCWRAHGRGSALRMLGAGALVFFALVLPFAAFDWKSFYTSSIAQWAQAMPRTDSLAFPALLAHKLRIPAQGLAGLYTPFSIASVFIWGGMVAWLVLRKARPQLHELFISTAVTYGWVLLFAKQSFCNYYYFLSIFIVAVAVSMNTAESRVPGRSLSVNPEPSSSASEGERAA